MGVARDEDQLHPEPQVPDLPHPPQMVCLSPRPAGCLQLTAKSHMRSIWGSPYSVPFSVYFIQKPLNLSEAASLYKSYKFFGIFHTNH